MQFRTYTHSGYLLLSYYGNGLIAPPMKWSFLLFFSGFLQEACGSPCQQTSMMVLKVCLQSATDRRHLIHLLDTPPPDRTSPKNLHLSVCLDLMKRLISRCSTLPVLGEEGEGLCRTRGEVAF